MLQISAIEFISICHIDGNSGTETSGRIWTKWNLLKRRIAIPGKTGMKYITCISLVPGLLFCVQCGKFSFAGLCAPL